MWKAGSGLLAAIGGAAALGLLSVSIDVLVFLMTAVIVGSIKFSLDLADECLARQSGYRTVPLSACAGTVVVAICGYVAAAGAATVALIAAVAATSPTVVSYLSDRSSAIASNAADDSTEITAPATPASDPDEQPADHLSDLELCIAWRCSYLSLERATSVRERLRIVQHREGILDELERRGPQQLAEWLQTGARAAGDPSRHFRRGPRRTS